MEKVPPGTVLDLFLENPDGGQLEKAGELIANRIGTARVEFETEGGALLPFGVPAVNAFFGRSLEVRLPGGDAKLRGTVPTP